MPPFPILAEIKFLEQLILDMCKLPRLAAGLIEYEEVADASRSRDQQYKLRGIGQRAIIDHGLVSGRDIRLASTRYVEGAEISLAFFRIKNRDAARVGRPHRQAATASPRRNVVA